MTEILAIIDDLVSGGSQLDKSCESSSLKFDCSEIHRLKLLIMLMKMYASINKNIGSIRVNEELNIGCRKDNNWLPLSVVRDMSSAIPRGSDMRSNPI